MGNGGSNTFLDISVPNSSIHRSQMPISWWLERKTKGSACVQQNSIQPHRGMKY